MTIAAQLSSKRMDWRTPQAVLQLLYAVFGEFDLDPCSPEVPHVRAKKYFTEHDDGLAREWRGDVVYVNPPYGRAIGRWTAKCREEVAAGRARCIVLLVPARTDTAWWRRNVIGHASIVFLKGRLKFDDGKGTAPFATCLVLYGATTAETDAIVAAFVGSASWRGSFVGRDPGPRKMRRRKHGKSGAKSTRAAHAGGRRIARARGR